LEGTVRVAAAVVASAPIPSLAMAATRCQSLSRVVGGQRQRPRRCKAPVGSADGVGGPAGPGQTGPAQGPAGPGQGQAFMLPAASHLELGGTLQWTQA
jgi:hypothetical protein